MKLNAKKRLYESSSYKENMQYDDTNRGALFSKSNKPSDTHPDYTGNLNVEGVDYWVSGWKKTSKAGDTYLSLSVTKKIEKQDQIVTDLPDGEIDMSEIPF